LFKYNKIFENKKYTFKINYIGGNLKYKSGTNNILEWWPSDHFGLVCEINK
jgi:hypothetical protein